MSDVGMPDPEQVARELAEELRTLRVEDVLVNALLAVSSIGYRRSAPRRTPLPTAISSRCGSRSTR